LFKLRKFNKQLYVFKTQHRSWYFKCLW